jgi:TetR/AcrR family transcriptional repressor of nem operon
MTPRAQTDTRDRLLEAAMHLFWEKSYADTAVAEILERADANSGSFYYFFKSKGDLLLAVLERYVTMLPSAILEPAFSKTEDPIERIFAILGGYRAALIETGCTFGCPIGKLSLEIGGEQIGIHRKIAENFANWAEAVRQCLESAAGRLPRDTDMKALSQFVLAVMEGGVMQARSHRSLEPFDAAVSQLRNYFDLLQQNARQLSPGAAPGEPSL